MFHGTSTRSRGQWFHWTIPWSIYEDTRTRGNEQIFLIWKKKISDLFLVQNFWKISICPVNNGRIKVFAVTHIYQNQKLFAKFLKFVRFSSLRSPKPFAESSLRSQIFFAVAHMCARCVGKFLHWPPVSGDFFLISKEYFFHLSLFSKKYALTYQCPLLILRQSQKIPGQKESAFCFKTR